MSKDLIVATKGFHNSSPAWFKLFIGNVIRSIYAKINLNLDLLTNIVSYY